MPGPARGLVALALGPLGLSDRVGDADELIRQGIGRAEQVPGHGEGQAVKGDVELRFRQFTGDGVDRVKPPAVFAEKGSVSGA